MGLREKAEVGHCGLVALCCVVVALTFGCGGQSPPASNAGGHADAHGRSDSPIHSHDYDSPTHPNVYSYTCSTTANHS